MCGTYCNSDRKTNFEPIWVKIEEYIYCDEEHKGIINKKKKKKEKERQLFV